MKYLVTAPEGPGFAFPEEAMKVLNDRTLSALKAQGRP